MIQTTLCYLEQNNSYLMLHRVKKKNDLNHDKWIGVGGKFEDAESPEDCMLREVQEETGLHPLSWKYCGIVTFVSNEAPTEYMHLFRVFSWTGKQIECDEGILEWISRDHLMQLPMWEGDKVFLNLLRDDTMPFFSLKLVYQGEKLIETSLNGIKKDGCK